ncbi:kinase-like domain-containing protein [Russula emetica]|nr:kinase-like domain-containing protein [Russula emetica]
MARCGQQYNPAPELLRGMHTAQPGAQAEVPISGLYYAGPPVDVWGLGVVLYMLVCGRVPFDEPTIDAIHKASLCSPASLHFPRRVSRGCRDLLLRMLQANPATRASLDEVLKHPWMNPSTFQHAALKWPDQVDRKCFYRITAIDSKNGDDAWRSLVHALELVSHLCEPSNGGDSRAHTRSFTSHMSRLSRVRELPDCLPGSAVALCWNGPSRSHL